MDMDIQIWIFIYGYPYMDYNIDYNIEDPYGGSTAAPRFWSSGALRSAGSLAALRSDVGRCFALVGNVLVLGFVLGKISAILNKISAILGKLGPSGRLGFVLGASWGRIGPLGRQVGALGGKLGSPC